EFRRVLFRSGGNPHRTRKPAGDVSDADIVRHVAVQLILRQPEGAVFFRQRVRRVIADKEDPLRQVAFDDLERIAFAVDRDSRRGGPTYGVRRLLQRDIAYNEPWRGWPHGVR